MKTYFTSKELPHLWANKSVPAGRCPAHESFEGDYYYSYNTIIAAHRTHKGKPWVLLNSRSYSPTTGGHMSGVRSALHGHTAPVFEIEGAGTGQNYEFQTTTPAQLFDYAVKQSAEAEAKAARARTNKDHYSGAAARWLEKAAKINTFFGLRRKVDAKVVSRLKEAAAREEKKNAALRKAEEARLAIINAERDALRRQWYEQWKNGAGGIDTHNFYNLPVAFRIEENELVSTLGARVPLDAARVALRFIMRRRGQEWRANGDRCPVGHYELSAINAAGVVAGCHRFSWDEVERVAGLLSESLTQKEAV